MPRKKKAHLRLQRMAIASGQARIRERQARLLAGLGLDPGAYQNDGQIIKNEDLASNPNPDSSWSQFDMGDVDHFHSERETFDEDDSMLVECKVEVKQEETPEEDELGEHETLEETSPDWGSHGVEPERSRRGQRDIFATRDPLATSPHPPEEDDYEGGGGDPQTSTCLLCADKITQNSTRISSNSCPSAKDTDCLVMFILKKMVGLPIEKLQKYLRLFGYPREWVSFCPRCVPTITAAFGIQKEINKLEDKLRKFQEEMKVLISLSYAKNEKKVISAIAAAVSEDKQMEDPLRVTRETWCHVGHGNFPKPTGNVSKPQRSNVTPRARKRKQELIPSTSSLSSPSFSFPCVIKGDEINELGDGGDNDPGDVNMKKSKKGKYDHCDLKWRTTKFTYKKNSIVHSSGYTCPLCPDLKTMDFDFFLRHITYHQGRPFKCSDCGTFLTGSDVELGKIPKLKHKKEGVPEDHVCTKATIVPVTFHPGNIWECGYCNGTFRSEEERGAHEKTVHNQKQSQMKFPYKCGWCSGGKKFRDHVEWRFHRVLEHPQLAKLACYYCDEIFVIKTKEGVDLEDAVNRRRHIQERHSRMALRPRFADCFICGKIFKVDSKHQDHLEQCHGVDRSQSRSCPICFSRYPTGTSLNMHVRHMHAIRLAPKEKFICDVCGYENVNGLKFQEHKFMKHGIEPEDGRPILSCTEAECSFKCTMKSTLEIHKMRAHNAARRHKCETCGKGFMSWGNLRDHRQIHLNAGVKPHQCEICGNSFAVKNYLYIHMRLSHQNRPFASTNKKKRPRSSGTNLNVGTSTPL